MSAYQDVINADLPLSAWALTESGGTDFAPYTGPYHLIGSSGLLYQQPGPFAGSFSVHVPAGGSLRTNGLPFPSAGGFIEWWFKLDVFPPSATEAAAYWGNSGSNGNGLLVSTTGALQLYAAPSAAFSIGQQFASGWHLLQIGNPGVNGGSAVALDGQIVYSKLPGVGGSAGNPDQIGFGCTASSTAAVASSVSFPAVYASYLTPQVAYAHYLAATNPNLAINYTSVGSGNSASFIQTISTDLSQVLALLSTTYQNSP